MERSHGTKIVFFSVTIIKCCLLCGAEQSALTAPQGNKCEELSRLIERHEDFPIEQVYPNIQVSLNSIPRGSKAFILWRQKTPPWIPDTAFNWHYYTPEQRRVAARFPVAAKPSEGMLVPSTGLPAEVTQFLTKKPTLVQYLPNELGMELRKTMIQKFGSAEKMLFLLGIDSDVRNKLAPIKEKQEEGRWFIDTKGQVVLFTESDLSKMVAALEGPHDYILLHQELHQILSSDFAHGYIDAGFIRYVKGKIKSESYEITSHQAALRPNGPFFDSRTYLLNSLGVTPQKLPGKSPLGPKKLIRN